MMLISKVHLSTITGEDYPAGWYRLCTLQVCTETVPRRLVQNMHPADWYKNCTLQNGIETVPSKLVHMYPAGWNRKMYPAGWYNMRVPCRLAQNVYPVYAVAGRYLFIITVSLTKLSAFHCTVSNEQILVNNESERWGRKRPRLNLFLYLDILLDGLRKITKKIIQGKCPGQHSNRSSRKYK